MQTDNINDLLDSIEFWAEKVHHNRSTDLDFEANSTALDAALASFYQRIKQIMDEGRTVRLRTRAGRILSIRSIARQGKYSFGYSGRANQSENLRKSFIPVGITHVEIL